MVKRHFIGGGRKKARQEGTLQEREITKTESRAPAMNLAFYGMGGVDSGVHDHFTSLGSLPHLLVLFPMGYVG